MNYDELAFFNQQLAAMLRDGIPLEGALKQLCAGMKTGPLRDELSQLESDLARGTPLDRAVARRSLPEFYTRMIAIGARSNDLPGVLTLLADYYQRASSAWNRLKGLMVYPFLVLLVSIGVTIAVSVLARNFIDLAGVEWLRTPIAFRTIIWIPPIIAGLLLLLGVIVISVPSLRGRARWWLPAFRETSLAQLASAMALMLKSGTPLPDALAFAASIEADSPAANALRQWHGLIASGSGKPAQWPESFAPLPPMFLWLVHKGGENITAGFEKAAEIYQSRASYKIELALYGALPISVLILGQMVLWQVVPVFQTLIAMMNMFSDVGGS
jgi:general secretion pathway protein F